MLCPIVTGSNAEEIKKQLLQAKPFSFDLLEWRLDFFSEAMSAQSLTSIKCLLPKPFIATLRSTSHGGASALTSAERRQFFEGIITALQPDYIDIEYPADIPLLQQVKSFSPKSKIILSYHNLEGIDHNLLIVLEKMSAFAVDYIKIAAKAKTTSEALQLLKIKDKTEKKTTVIALGDKGQPGRLMGPIFGETITYCSIEPEGSESFKGAALFSLQTLSEVYRYKSISSQTKLYGLLGGDITKSLSHITHNGAMQKNNLSALYLKMAATTDELPVLLKELQDLNFLGLSITMPLKTAIMPYLYKTDAMAEKIGAVNTLVFTAEGYVGYNTDGEGALRALEEVISVKNKKIAILGAGGAAKAIAFTAKERGALITISNRTQERGLNLATLLGGNFLPLTADFKDFDIVINCISSPLAIDPSAISSEAVVMDIISKPLFTEFLEKAQEKGCRVVPGYKMFIHQALLQYEKWFPDTYNSQEKKKSLLNSLEKDALFALKPFLP